MGGVRTEDTRLVESHDDRAGDGASHGLGAFLESRAHQIVAAWAERVRCLPPAREIPSLALVNHLPDILARLAIAVDSDERVSLAEGPHAHAVDRLSRGFDLREVVREYSILRRCILDLWDAHMRAAMDAREAKRLHLAIDQAVEEATVRFSTARERALRALDKISEAALGTEQLDEFLEQLLQATLETSDVVGSAAVLLREGEWLRVRAAVGLQDAELGVRTKIGEGFLGGVASKRTSDSLRMEDAGVRAVHAVPLVHHDECVGVVRIASATAYEFSEEDKLLFKTLASRATDVIVQAQLVTELRAAEARLRLAMEATHLGTWDLNLLTGEAQWSAGMMEIFGVQFQPPVGGSVDRIHPADRGAVAETVTRSYDPKGDGRFGSEYRVRVNDDGELRWVASRGRTFFDEHGRPVRMVGTTLDVTARKRAEIASQFLSDATAVLASSLDYVKAFEEVGRLAVPRVADWAVVTLVEGNGQLTDVTVVHSDPSKADLLRKLLRQYPYDPDASAGVASVVRTGRPALVPTIDDAVLAGLAPDPERRRILRELGFKSYLVVPMVARERVLGAIALASAETSRRFDNVDVATAEHLGRRAALAIDNARLYEDAREATRHREQVLAIVSHDLRNPLSAIQFASKLVWTHLSKSNDPTALRQVTTIERSVARMERLIGDLLDVASIQAGRLSVETRACALSHLVEEGVASQEVTAGQKGIALRFEVSCPNVMVRADPNRIQQVLANLIGNAIKFSPRGEIFVRAEAKGNDVIISVRDTGPGISPDELERVFAPYWSSARHVRSGTGLGLYISRGIVEAHGGRIWAESIVGVGSTFFFTVPPA